MTGAARTGTAASHYAAAQARGDINAENAALHEHADGHNQAVGGWGITGIGGAALVAGVVMIAVAPRAHRSTATQPPTIAPWVDRSDGGLTASGHF